MKKKIKCKLIPPPFIKKKTYLSILKIHPVGYFYSSLSKNESLSHPLSKGIHARNGVISDKALDCPKQNRVP